VKCTLLIPSTEYTEDHNPCKIPRKLGRDIAVEGFYDKLNHLLGVLGTLEVTDGSLFLRGGKR
jgi:hypothetical protein